MLVSSVLDFEGVSVRRAFESDSGLMGAFKSSCSVSTGTCFVTDVLITGITGDDVLSKDGIGLIVYVLFSSMINVLEWEGVIQ